ncbi:multidrug DMT transporter [Deinococcus wulumuqiensis]|uniref:multidrug DMT transporter n=1 Tax=Deinococcus wulumuqiensis TaxID=980427 RepID=UPI002430CB3C|nr:multidrug DMT transporter [Deinococcus wulumuqiensis]
MDTLKKAGAMLPHLDLFQSMLDLRRLLQLAAHMKERGDRAMLISGTEITLIGGESLSAPEIVTSKGETVDAATAYRVLGQLEGYDAPEYAVNREALAALNARAVAELEGSDALRAFGETLARISAAPTDPAGPERPGTDRAASERAAAERATSERAARPRRTPDAETPRSEAAEQPTDDSAPAA